MILTPTFTNGRGPDGGPSTTSSKIPPTALRRIRRTKSSVETIVALLNEAESLHSWRQKNALVWSECPHCRAIFVGYRKHNRRYCSRQCNGHYRGTEWAKHAHKGRAAWTDASRASYAEKMTGPKNPAWKGGLTYYKRKGKYANQSNKYVRCPPEFADMARKDGYVMEHRLVMAEACGFLLTRTECVNHEDHDPTNNDPANLAALCQRCHILHVRGEHLRRRRLTYLARRALGHLFTGPYGLL